jgi:transcriptional regulator with XRE-family HTH domain
MGNVLAERRKELKMSMRELADSTGTTPEYIEGIENGSIENPPVGLLSQISETLQLVEGDDTIYVPNEKYGERHIETRGYAEIDGIPVIMILVSEAEENLIKRYRKLSPLSQATVLNLMSSLEQIDKTQKEQSASEVG